MSSEPLIEQLRVFLPKYLSPTQHTELWQELRAFPKVSTFYLPEQTGDPDLLQGDGWAGFVAVNVERMERRTVHGIIVSNSCDIDLANTRALIPQVVFAPLIAVSAYEGKLDASNLGDEAKRTTLEAIRRQEVTNIFHLPALPYGPEESLVVLDTIQSQPVTMFAQGERRRLFRLNQVAFYTFLIKLSIHFTRFNESVARFPLAHAS